MFLLEELFDVIDLTIVLKFEEIVNTSFEDIRNGGDPASVMQSAESRIEQAMRRYK